MRTQQQTSAGQGTATTGTKVTTRRIQTNNRSGSFSARAEYTPIGNGLINVDDWTWDAMGIIPNGIETRILPLAEAQAEYKERLAHGWTA